MKKKILLIEESLTVQKVVALTFSRNLYLISYAKSYAEAKQLFKGSDFDCVIISDQIADFDINSFSVETICPQKPPVVLITAQEINQNPKVSAVVRKPFSPSTLQKTVEEVCSLGEKTLLYENRITEKSDSSPTEEALQEQFNKAFNDETKLVKETLIHEPSEDKTLINIPPPETDSLKPESSIWEPIEEKLEEIDFEKPITPIDPNKSIEKQAAPLNKKDNSYFMDIEESLAYKTSLENKVEAKIAESDLTGLVNRALEKLLPPIVERLVKERLDELMKEEERV